ncbi:O-antigen ligase family protein [uncultured Thermanaerothrix sp.]|uniref:O-antigen ligase family protein n=1 Tax=uncultured Thermanaerothrix sp. TaxID=1195149 RepID=UPI0026370C44|nr:O-antigen ligase family protein [uncultured Thermanaerothrix sp.]
MGLLLPLTSFPLIAQRFNIHSVAPAAALPLVGLLLLWYLPYLISSVGYLPHQAIPLFVFATIAVLSSLLSFFIPFPPFRSPDIWSNIREGLLTLGIGGAFYMLTATWIQSSKRLEFVLRLLHLGGIIVIFWSFWQAFVWYTRQGYPTWMFVLQSHLTSNGRLFDQRVTGLAFEPSWLAHQLNLLYLPLWLAATLQRASVFRFRVLGLSLENLCLLGGGAVLFLSFSRVGWLAFLCTLAYLILRANLALIRWLQAQIQKRLRLSLARWMIKLAVPSGLALALVTAYASLFLGAGFVLSRLDPRMRDLFRFEFVRTEGWVGYANRLVFAERLVYWQTGYRIFADYPWLGVGLGNAGYFFPQKMVAFGWALTEVQDLMFRNSFIPNTKSLWVRLLTETGILGFVTFLTWLYVLWATARSLEHAPDPHQRTIGWATSLGLIALLVEGFSVDTFALPYFWTLFGLATASTSLPLSPIHAPAPLERKTPREA